MIDYVLCQSAEGGSFFLGGGGVLIKVGSDFETLNSKV